jgi:apolipoprotein D and lipocalin family protein
MGSSVSSTSKIDGVETNWDLYLGTWYEQYRIPSWFETAASANVTANYQWNKNKTSVQVLNRSVVSGVPNEAKGVAYPVKGRTGVLSVSFFKPFFSDYVVLEHGADYEYTIVGGSTKDYLWLLTRSKEATPEQKQRLFALGKQNGYDISRLQKTPMN